MEENIQLNGSIQNEFEWLDTTDGYVLECISVENLRGFIDRLKQKYPNDADLGEAIRNLNLQGND